MFNNYQQCVMFKVLGECSTSFLLDAAELAAINNASV